MSICAGATTGTQVQSWQAAARPAGQAHVGQRSALILVATFAEDSTWADVPDWGSRLLDPSQPGSLSHFYDTMSFGALRIRGEVGPHLYRASHPASHYLSSDGLSEGAYGDFALEILAAADRDIDYARFDNDGPDGMPSSGDDDGLVDIVFIVVPYVPAGFLRGVATGMERLGPWNVYTTRDPGQAGRATLVAAGQGTIQRGTTYAEAVGVMCHEYGHVLGLPDLFNTEYLRSADAPPEEDSAGIGAWGLMGWGASGWEATPGPNSLSAWSRLHLGWATVSEPDSLDVSIQLPQVGASGQLYRIPLSGGEYLLLEYRRRNSTYYDRGIPAEGLLVWHAGRSELGGELSPRWEVDLECADGQWADAGFPLGARADARGGGDNLDFWSHDDAYATSHAGNLGDATDPFDGVIHRHFTPETNPAATSRDGQHGVHLTDITIDGDLMHARLQRDAPLVELIGVAPQGKLVAAGVPVAITFRLANTGGIPAPEMRAEVRTDDELLEILDPQLELSPLPVGSTTVGSSVGPQGFPYVRFPAGLEDEHSATVEVEVFAGNVSLARSSIVVTGVPAHRFVATTSDSLGTPLPGISVRLQPMFGQTQLNVFYTGHDTTDTTGIATLSVPTGEYSLIIEPTQGSHWGVNTRRILWVDADAHLELVLPRTVALSGTVRDSGGNPAGGHSVQLQSTQRFLGTYTDDDGRYTVRVPPGRYDVSTSRYVEGLSVLPQEHGQVQLDGDAVLDITLQAGLRLNVDVYGVEGTRVEGAEVAIGSVDEPYPSRWSTTGAEVGASFEVLPGTYRIVVEDAPAPHLPRAEPTQVSVLGDTSVSIVLARGLLVSGSLVDATGAAIVLQPEDDVTMSFTTLDGEPRYYSASVGSRTGRFAVGVPAGRLRVSVDTWYYGTGTGTLPDQDLGVIQIEGDTTLALAVDSGVVVEGRLHGDLGEQDGGYSVYLDAASGTGASASPRADGTFSVRVIPGEYAVSINVWVEEMSAPSQFLQHLGVHQDTLVDLYLRDDEILEGKVLKSNGAPAVGLRIYASGTSDSLGVRNQATTRDDGTFAIRLVPSAYVMRANTVGSGQATTSWLLDRLDVPPVESPTYVLPGGASLSMRITGETGAVGGSVSLHPWTFDLVRYLRQLTAGTLAVQAWLGAGDTHEFELKPEEYSAVVSPDRYGTDGTRYSRVFEQLSVAEASELVVALPSPGADRLTGSVTDSDGPLSSATLYFYDAELGLMAQARVRSGRYGVSLPSGRFRVAVLEYSPDRATTVHDAGFFELESDSTWNIAVHEPTAVTEASDPTPQRFALEQNYPNPFNATTVIRFTTERQGHTEIAVFDLLGQRVRTLVRRPLAAGPHVVFWDGRDEAGRRAATGLYLYRLTSADRSRTRKLLLVR